MSNPKISIIVPIYNCEQFLEETLNSVVNQTIFEDIEVLMIDDGSTDNSRYIIEKYDLNYENFHAFYKKNEGQGIARNYGINKAKGEYIHFLDADDYVISEAYEKLYNLASSNDYDFIVFNAMRFAQYNCWHDQLFKKSFKNLSKKMSFHSINECPSLVWDTLVWNKLYKKEFLLENNLNFLNKKIFYEDLLFSIESYIKSKSFCFINEYYYFWRLRTNNSSVTQNHNSIQNFKDRLNVIGLIKKYIVSNLNDETRNILYEKWLIHDFKLFIKNINEFPVQYHEEILDEILDIIDEFPQKIFENLNSYYKTIYQMLRNKDYKSLLCFAPLENILNDNSYFNFQLDDSYIKDINFTKDVLDEELFVKISNIENDDKNLLITFDYNLKYLSNQIHNFEAILLDDKNDEETLEIQDNRIFLPFDLLLNKNTVRIKIRLITDSFIKESYLKNEYRTSIIYNNHDIEVQFGINSILLINLRDVNDKEVVISDIEFKNDEFIFKGNSLNNFESVFIENIIDFKKINYPVFFKRDDFYFKIPYSDMLNHIIKKWELKSDNLIKVSHTFNFYNEYDKITIENYRNKILIYDNLYDKFEKL